MMTPRKRLRSRRGGSGWDARLGPLGRPCAPTSGLSEGCPHHPRTGASPALRLHELGGLIRRRVGLTLAVNLGVGRGPLKLVPMGDPLRSPLRRGLHPPACCTTLLARRRVLCDKMQHALSRVIAVVAAEKVGAVGKTRIDVNLLRSR